MKKIFTLTALILGYVSTFSQDLIVTNKGDSINCNITKVKTDNIYFTFKHKDEYRNTLLPVVDIKTHQLNYFQTYEVPKDKIKAYKNYQSFRIAINGGYSYHIAKIAESVPNELRGYAKSLKSGYHWGGDISYFFSEPLGIGFKYYQFSSSNSLDNIYITDADGITNDGKMSDDINISFIGPFFSTRLLNHNKRNALLFNLSFGYMGYSNHKIFIDSYKMTGSTMGMSLDIGYDIGLSENLSLGFQVSLLTGALSEYEWSDGIQTQNIELGKGEYESLNRIDFAVGLRFHK